MRRIIIILLSFGLPLLLFPQKGSNKYISGNYTGFTAEVGITSFFGDIDEGAAKGDVLNNNMAYKFQVSRNIKALIDLSGRISFGNMSGEKKRSSGTSQSYYYFKNEFVEYTLDVGINLLSIFTRNFNKRFGLYGSVGMGLIDFKVKLYDGTNDSIVKSFGYDDKSTTEFVLPLGIRAIYHISPSSSVSIQTTSSRVDTDKLDGKTGNDNRDYYNYFSIGYTFKIAPKSSGLKRPGSKKPSVRKKPSFKR